MEDLTVGPVLTWSTEAMLGHVDKLLKIPGAAPALAASFLAALCCLEVAFTRSALVFRDSGRTGHDLEALGVRALLVRGMQGN